VSRIRKDEGMNTLQWTSMVWAALLSLSAGAQANLPQGQAHLELTADAGCTLSLNGKTMGALSPGLKRTLSLPPGQFEVACTGADTALAHAREQVSLRAGETQSLRLRLRWVAVAAGVMDNVRRLLWTRQDNGTDVDWPGAVAWCESLGPGWRLPSRVELEDLTASAYGETTPCRGSQCKVPALFILSSYWMWSGDRNTDGRAVYHYLHTGHTQSWAVDYRLNARALCLRP
jgi:hypothetical protein